MSTVFLFTGENGFALRQEKERWMAEFREKHGSENLLLIDGLGISLRELLDEVSVSPFIAEKRLVIVRGIPRYSKEEMQVLLQSVHPASILLFCDASPDKRLGGVKELLASVTVKAFTPLTGKALTDWMQEWARKQGASLERPAAELLLQIVGEDQEMLAQEIRKLALGGVITATRVQLLAVPSGEQEVWQLTTLLSRGDANGALTYARTLLRSGEDPFSLWNVLLWLLRCLAAVTLCAHEGERNPAKIAAAASVPFPTAKMLLPLAQSISLPDLRDLVDWGVAADRDLKTGGYRATADAMQELLALTDALIVRCCRTAASRPSFQSA